MPGSTLDSSLADDLRTDFKHLDIGCRLFLGVSAKMFRAVRELSNIAVLVFAVYLMEATLLSTEVAVGVAILLYLGPAGIEQYLVRQGVIADRDSEGDNE